MVSNSVIETLEKRLANLVEQWTQVNNQINIESDYEKRQLFKMRANDLLQEMDDLEAKIQQIKNSINNANPNYVNIQDNLPEIDFKDAVSVVESIKQKFGKDLGAALFLLEDSFRLSGNLLINKIKKLISDNICSRDTET